MAGVEVTVLFDPTKHAHIKTNLLGTGTGRLAVLESSLLQDLARLPNAACLALMKERPEMPDKVYLQVLREIKQERRKIKEDEIREEESRQETAQEEARQKTAQEEFLKVDDVTVLGSAAIANSM